MTTSVAASDPASNTASGATPPGIRERNDLIVRHMPLAKRLARRYARHPESFEDVEQVAAIGLIKAAGRFDATRGVAFSSYAVPTIVGEIKRYFRDTSWAVHVPRALQERAQRVEATTKRLADVLDRSPSPSEVADALELSVEDVLEARTAYASFHAESLDAPSISEGDGDSDSRGDQLGTIDGAYTLVEDRVAIQPAMSSLSERERLVLFLRFGFDLTQREIGERIGVSQMHISRLLRRSLETVRSATEY
jgi:RNA polymerase sigma-B factor